MRRFTALKALVSVGLAQAFTACASLSFKVPVNKFLTPEADGSTFSSRVGMGYGSAAKISVASHNDLMKTPPETASGKVTPDDMSNVHLEMAVYQPIDVFVSTIGTGFKVQVLGDSVKEAKPGGNALAFAYAGASGSSSLEATSFLSVLGAGSMKVSAKLDYKYHDVMMLAGRRVSESELLYVNAGIMDISADGNITQTTTSSSGETTVSDFRIPRKKGRQWSVLAGYQVSSRHFYMILEPGISQASWSGAEPMRRFALGGTVGLKF